ncbi:hypothetical protein K1W54_07225, partial [Micromonospora sp. CPCC 205371]|nr:hypothetical protein [Micromonospora sp. CPCC 205371]
PPRRPRPRAPPRRRRPVLDPAVLARHHSPERHRPGVLAQATLMKVVQAMLRHSSVTVTGDTYTSVLPDLARNAAEQTAAIVPRRATITPINQRAAG